MPVKFITCICDQQSRCKHITTVQSDCSVEKIKLLFTEVTRLPGFSLTTEVCVVDCGPHGSCIGGVCQCEEGWTGPECEQRDCHPRCIDHGVCREGKCDCHQGWTGEHCTIGEYAHRRLNVSHVADKYLVFACLGPGNKAFRHCDGICVCLSVVHSNIKY